MTKSIQYSTRKRLSTKHRPFSTRKTLSKKHIPFSTRKKIHRDRLSMPKIFKSRKSKKNIHQSLDGKLVADSLAAIQSESLAARQSESLAARQSDSLASDSLASDSLINDSLINESLIKKRKIDASNTIGKFMKNTDDKRKGVFLKMVCSDSGACLAVGAEIKRINQFFNHYTDFKYAINPVKSIGAPSANGFVKEITYSRDGYNSYAILKSSMSPDSDNLMYEYAVGQYINKQNKIFSCFLETYGAYVYKSDTYKSLDIWNYFRDIKDKDINSLKTFTTPIPDINYETACRDAQYIAILIQHINNAISFDKFIHAALAEPDAYKKNYYLNVDVFTILYQIYFVLDILKNEFTHYDLHTQNVLLYEPVKGGYITYHYHLNSGETVEFQSKYIAKIIDYGRSYYYEDAANNSKKTYDLVCKTGACKPNCGENFGFTGLGPEKYPGSFYHISSQSRNMSHDLRLADMVKGYLLPTNNIISINRDLLLRIVYKHRFGTPERKNGYPHTIHNVSDMRIDLESILLYQLFKEENERYHASFSKIGDMHIYEDRRPMEYVKFV